MDERRSLPTSHTKDELDHLRSLPTSHERDERRSLSPSSDEEDERTDELWEVGLMLLYRSRLTVKNVACYKRSAWKKRFGLTLLF